MLEALVIDMSQTLAKTTKEVVEYDVVVNFFSVHQIQTPEARADILGGLKKGSPIPGWRVSNINERSTPRFLGLVGRVILEREAATQ